MPKVQGKCDLINLGDQIPKLIFSRLEQNTDEYFANATKVLKSGKKKLVLKYWQALQ